ncbi:MAG TPA: D-cysteine desulfhydrase family protein [Acidimicrobiia bacterium]|nr:D-cysteine desulfhydrase family protein [Acidimicrobiia bacterium]
MQLPRVALAQLPTPLEPMDRFSEWLGGPHVLVKRDDLTGLALGGNKARKLEYLCGEAQSRGCDVLVTGGGAQSNHARMTAAAANRLGLDCHLAVGGNEPRLYSGNLLLDRVLGATLHFTGADSYYEVESAIEKLAAQLTADGRRPFAMPIGGASVTGASAYVSAGEELVAQADAAGAAVDWIVVADGSGGTHAGLLAALGGRARVLGVDVGTRPDLEDVIPKLAAETAAHCGRAAPDTELVLDRDRFGDGYGAVTDAALEAIERVAHLEGIVLDPVYTGKAMAGLIAATHGGRFGAGDTVVFWHTGGAVALFAHRYAAVFSR